MKYRTIGPFAIVFAAILWSLDGLLRRHLYHLPPTVIVFSEHAFGLIVLLVATSSSWKKFKELSRKQWLSIILVAFLSGALGTILYTSALIHIQYISYSVVVLLQQLQPLFAIATASVLLKERIGWKYLLLAAIALAAAYGISFPNLQVDLTTGQGTLIAALLAIGAAACWGTSTAFSKYSLNKTSTLHVTTLRFGFTVLFAFGFSIILGQTEQINTITPNDILYILLITFSTGMLALALYYFGLKRVMASRSAILELAWPISAALIGLIFLHEQLTITQWIGTLILMIVMRLIIREQRLTHLLISEEKC